MSEKKEYVPYEELDERSKLVIERIDKILKERITSAFEERLVDVNYYINDVLWTLRLITDLECVYEFDNKPLIWNKIYGTNKNEYVSFETAIDVAQCGRYEINITITRLTIKLGGKHLQQITNVVNVSTFVKRGESK